MWIQFHYPDPNTASLLPTKTLPVSENHSGTSALSAISPNSLSYIGNIQILQKECPDKRQGITTHDLLTYTAVQEHERPSSSFAKDMRDNNRANAIETCHNIHNDLLIFSHIIHKSTIRPAATQILLALSGG